MFRIFLFFLTISFAYSHSAKGADSLSSMISGMRLSQPRVGNDLVVKGNGERIYCTIDSVDSFRLYVTVKRIGEDAIRLKFRKKELRYYEYDYYVGELEYATPTTIGYGNAMPGIHVNKKTSAVVTLGFGQTGGIIGADLEFAVGDYIGLQFGLGLISADVAINFHVQKTLESPYISIFARNQFLFLNGIGISYNYRSKDGLALQLGVSLINENAEFFGGSIEPPAIQVLVFSIGKYFSL